MTTAKEQRRSRLDAWRDHHVARATRFTVVVYVGLPAMYDTRKAESLEAARALRDKMVVEYGASNYGRRPIIYAVTPEELTVFVE